MHVQNHVFTYDEPIKVESVTQSVSDLALRFGEGANEEEASMVRFPSLLPRLASPWWISKGSLAVASLHGEIGR